MSRKGRRRKLPQDDEAESEPYINVTTMLITSGLQMSCFASMNTCCWNGWMRKTTKVLHKSRENDGGALFNKICSMVCVADIWFVAHIIMLREREVALLFEEIKEVASDFDPKYFMTDDCNTFYNGFRQVFPQSAARKLLCLFHVVQSLCQEVERDFALKYAGMITRLHQEGEQEMAEYFEENWSPRVEQFAGFARRRSCVNTSMLIERWNKRLKYELVNIKRGIRIDSLVDILISAPAIMEEDRVIKMARGLNYGRHRLLRHHGAHVLAVKLYGNKPEAVEVLGEGWWRLTDSKGIHHIRQYTCICDEKHNNHCKRCNACAYAFSCDCVNDALSGVSCPHIHAILMHAPGGLLRDNLDVDEELPICNEVEVVTSNTSDPCDSLDGGKENAYSVVEKPVASSILDKNKEILNELETVGILFFARLEHAITSLLQYIVDIRSHFIQLLNVPDDEATQSLKHLAASMHSMGVDARAAFEQLRVKRKEGLVCRSELPVVGGLPNHTPIRLQKVHC
ncbi:unnamed protein product [Heligmosomoides polygyrus]|uniref:SWIM-type domain-containing protein n=1 Tax=Heligmosomoides polygyrus TaxID=6339 RepID=A0A183FVF0_HELPZ|nr:unnamed protein product [Heligmosomoides polygyrus]